MKPFSFKGVYYNPKSIARAEVSTFEKWKTTCWGLSGEWMDVPCVRITLADVVNSQYKGGSYSEEVVIRTGNPKETLEEFIALWTEAMK